MKCFISILLVCMLTSCGGGKKSGVELESGEEGTGAGEYLDPESEVVVIHGEDDQSYVFEGEALEGNVLVVDDKEIDVFDEKDNEPTCEKEDMFMDVIIVNGEIVDVICYPPPQPTKKEQNYVEVTPQGGDMEIPKNENNKVIVFDPQTDGQLIEGDINIDSNNVAIHGNGVDNTIIDGDVTVSGNNPVIRGVTITGNLTLNKNNAAVLFCRIEGDLIVNKNNVTIAQTEVLGNMEFDAGSPTNNALLVNNLVAGEWNIRGQNHVCSGNSSFNDENGDKMFSEGEEGAELSCP